MTHIWDDIRIMPTVLERDGPVKAHESVLRAYHILEEVKTLLYKGVPAEVVYQIVELLETDFLKPEDDIAKDPFMPEGVKAIRHDR